MADKPKTKLGQAITTGQKSNLTQVQGQGLAGGKRASTTTFAKQLDKRLNSLFCSQPKPSPDLPNQGYSATLSQSVKGTSGKQFLAPVKGTSKGGVAK